MTNLSGLLSFMLIIAALMTSCSDETQQNESVAPLDYGVTSQ